MKEKARKCRKYVWAPDRQRKHEAVLESCIKVEIVFLRDAIGSKEKRTSTAKIEGKVVLSSNHGLHLFDKRR